MLTYGYPHSDGVESKNAKLPHHQFRPLAHQQQATVKLLHPHKICQQQLQLRQKKQQQPQLRLFGIDCNRSSKFNGNKNHDNKSKPKQNSGLDRYIHIKRELSPQNTAVGNKSKINRVQIENKLPGRSDSKRFALLDEN